jgi:hypothetical protein
VPEQARYGLRGVTPTLLVLQHIACEPPAAFEASCSRAA